jgi:hypothetical protein
MGQLELLLAKVEWAKARINTLEAGIKDFIGPDTYNIESYPDLNVAKNRLEIVVTGEALVDPPNDIFGPAIGEIVHQLRSSLDNLVWTLSDNHSTAPPPPKFRMERPWRLVRFPVTFEPSEWGGAVGRDLAKVDPALHTIFKELQPWFTHPSVPEFSDICCLEQLWNTDKHRHLSLVSSFVGLDTVLSRWPSQVAELSKELNVEFDILEQRAAGPFERGAKVELGRVEWRGNFMTTVPEMHVDPKIAFDVAFGQGPPAYGAHVVSELRLILGTVETTIRKFVPYLRR